ncbi:MAG TPA: TMEM165/GDT1 family protein [Bdellovibrionales bacterium]|nr:TMEM165/GDT1 family protein [Bdellovibrionales bacterium]
MDAAINSFLLVFVSERGDNTQLLALILTARYQKPWTIFTGVFVATVLNHTLAGYAGGWLAGFANDQQLKWGLALTFFAFAVWILIPDKAEDLKHESRFGCFVTTVVAFFLAEMGDKTQLATIALGARYASLTAVAVGTTLGMVAANALAVFLGERLLKRLPMKWIRGLASLLFVLFGIAIIIGL